MYNPEERKDIADVVCLLCKMDKTGIAIMMANANVLIARQELEQEKKTA